MGRFRIGVWQRYASAKGDGLLSALALALLRPILVVWVPAKRCWTQRPGLDLAGATHIQPIAAGSDLMWEKTGLSREREHDANLLYATTASYILCCRTNWRHDSPFPSRLSESGSAGCTRAMARAQGSSVSPPALHRGFVPQQKVVW